MICYDGNFVEPARLLALAGAQLLACPLNNDLRQAVAARRAIRNHAKLIARAVENDCWVIAADVCGAQAGRVGLGCTRIIGLDGQVVAASAPDEQTLLMADIAIPKTSLLHGCDVRRNPAVLEAWRHAHT